MGFLLPTSFSNAISRRSSLNLFFNGDFSLSSNLLYRKKFSCISFPFRILSRNSTSSSSGCFLDGEGSRDLDSVVEVIGIGSRKDAVLDYCLESSFESTVMRFWTIPMRDELNAQLLQRSLGKDMLLRSVEGPLSTLSSSRAIILVASTGYGVDHITAIELLRALKLADGLAVAIVLKPFSFEGQRRQHEVEDLVSKLQDHTNFLIVVETDALLKKEIMTLDEALKSANNAVLLAINAISVLMSEMHPKFLDAPHDKIKELKAPEVLRLLESYREAKVGFGADYSIKSSIARAVFDCPFLSGSLKDFNGIVICTLATASVMDKIDLHTFMHAFRQTTECTGEIIFSKIYEPTLEPNLFVTTLLIIGCNKQKASQKKSFLSDLALHFPFVFSLLGRDHPESKDHKPAQPNRNSCPEEITGSSDSGDMAGLYPTDGTIENVESYSKEQATLLRTNNDEVSSLRKSNGEDQRREVGILEPSLESSLTSDYHQTNEGEPAFQRGTLSSWNVGPGFHIAQEWAKERAAVFRGAPKIEKLSVYALPVGVKSFGQSMDAPQFSDTPKSMEQTILDDMARESLDHTNASWDAFTDAGFDAVMNIYNAASTLLKRKHVDVSRKERLLSVRAASMLEAERDSEKKWTPIMEMHYRGGIYRGRCQGGLPEGKGRLKLMDGSFYEGMWKYGKRSGLGAFYYSNGDVFQGSWRDDLMHGKGWFYFHTGDRWFANFWKGKANGEGRFYSKFGNIFFGHFQDGWRHGQCLCIDCDGTRKPPPKCTRAMLSYHHPCSMRKRRADTRSILQCK